MSPYLCDTNFWLALALSQHTSHAAARAWLDPVDEAESILLCRATQQSLLRLLTNASVLAPYGNAPLTNDAAWRVYEELLADDRIVLRDVEPAGLETHWKAFGLRATASPKLWMDAYLAAFARAEGCTMVTTDAAFRQFGGVETLVLGVSPAP